MLQLIFELLGTWNLPKDEPGKTVHVALRLTIFNHTNNQCSSWASKSIWSLNQLSQILHKPDSEGGFNWLIWNRDTWAKAREPERCTLENRCATILDSLLFPPIFVPFTFQFLRFLLRYPQAQILSSAVFSLSVCSSEAVSLQFWK